MSEKKEEFLSEAEEEEIVHKEANNKNIKWIVGLVVLIIGFGIAMIVDCDLPQKQAEANVSVTKTVAPATK